MSNRRCTTVGRRRPRARFQLDGRLQQQRPTMSRSEPLAASEWWALLDSRKGSDRPARTSQRAALDKQHRQQAQHRARSGRSAITADVERSGVSTFSEGAQRRRLGRVSSTCHRHRARRLQADVTQHPSVTRQRRVTEIFDLPPAVRRHRVRRLVTLGATTASPFSSRA